MTVGPHLRCCTWGSLKHLESLIRICDRPLAIQALGNEAAARAALHEAAQLLAAAGPAAAAAGGALMAKAHALRGFLAGGAA